MFNLTFFTGNVSEVCRKIYSTLKLHVTDVEGHRLDDDFYIQLGMQQG